MSSNLGKTTLKSAKPSISPMGDYDHLPADLRAWVARAALPWGAKSVARAYEKALRRTKHPAHALEELDRLQQRKLAKDARRIWDPNALG